MKKFLFLIFSIFYLPVFADPIVFGMELGKTTVSEIKRRSDVDFLCYGKDEYTMGDWCILRDHGVGDLLRSRIVFDKNQILVAVLLEFRQNALATVVGSLRKKYPGISMQAAMSRKGISIANGGSRIHLQFERPKYSFLVPSVHLNYTRREFDRAVKTLDKERKNDAAWVEDKEINLDMQRAQQKRERLNSKLYE